MSVPAEQREILKTQLQAVTTAVTKQQAGTTNAPRSVATSESTLDELTTLTTSLQRQHQDELKARKQTTAAAAEITASAATARTSITNLILTAADSKEGALVASGPDAAGPKPGIIAAGEEPIVLLQRYLDAAAAVKASHDAAVAAEAAAAAQAAAEAAARAGQDTYTDPSTGETKSTPRSNGGSSGGGSSSGGGGSSSGGGAGGGAGGGGATPPAPTVTPGPVTFSGANYSGCVAGAQIDGGYFTNDPSPHVNGSYGVPWTGKTWIEGQRSYYTIYQCSGGGAGGW